jgi:hypothetical protein
MPLVLLQPGEYEELLYRPSNDRLWMVSLVVQALDDLRPEPSVHEPKIRARIYEGIHAMRESRRREYESMPIMRAWWAHERREWHEAVGSSFTLMLGDNRRGTWFLMRVENLSSVPEVFAFEGLVADCGEAPALPKSLSLEEMSRATGNGLRPARSAQPAQRRPNTALYDAMMKSAVAKKT